MGGAEGDLRGSGICMLVGDAHCCMAETEKKKTQHCKEVILQLTINLKIISTI